MCILIVEDDSALVDSLQAYLQQEGFDTQTTAGEQGAREKLQTQCVDLALVDLALADGSGLAVCTCAQAHAIPVIFLTASGDENSVVRGLDMGAEDYISKPFRPRELVSRIRTVLRRCGRVLRVVTIGDLTVDLDRGEVSRDGQLIALSALEYRLLAMFVNERGRLLTRDRILEEIWDAGGDFVNDNTLTVYIKRLREKIERDPQHPRLICTVRGLGYRMEDGV